MFKRERVKCGSISAAARLLHRDIPTPPTDLLQFRRAKLMSRNLRAVLAGVPRPTQAEIDADEYDGSVSVLEWLGRSSRKND
jgi:hypothetical protein